MFSSLSLLFLGTALFSTLIHVKNGKILWIVGAVILFAGTYIMYSADGVSFWSESIFSNTTILGFSMMFYMLFLLMALLHFLKNTKKRVLGYNDNSLWNKYFGFFFNYSLLIKNKYISNIYNNILNICKNYLIFI